MNTLEKTTNTVNVFTEYICAGFSKKSYPAWVRHHFPGKEPHLASIKTTFFVPPREMIKAIQNSQKYKVNAEKREAWLNQAYADLKVQYKLNFDSILESKMFKLCFNLITKIEALNSNIAGMSYSTRERAKIDIDDDKGKLFEDVLKEFKNIDLDLPIWVSIEEVIELFKTFGIETRGKEVYPMLNQILLADSSMRGPNINEKGEIFINDVYLILIRKLWK
jgi:hypothetical protein